MAILHTNIGICKWKTYLYDDAKKEFEKAVNRDHTYEKAQKWLKYYEDFWIKKNEWDILIFDYEEFDIENDARSMIL